LHLGQPFRFWIFNAQIVGAVTRKGAHTMRIADLEVVDSPIVKESIELAQTLSPPYLFNHVMRSWLLATLVAPQAETPPDPELLAVAVILHDLAGP